VQFHFPFVRFFFFHFFFYCKGFALSLHFAQSLQFHKSWHVINTKKLLSHPQSLFPCQRSIFLQKLPQNVLLKI